MEQKINYQNKLDALLNEIKESSKTPSLLLHSCCGPCSSYVLDYLKDYFKITVFYYNPNIYPEEEYEHRLSEQKRLIDMVYSGSPAEDQLQTSSEGRDLYDESKCFEVKLLTLPYDHREFLEAAKGYEAEPEGGARCVKCFELRLNKTAEIAKEQGFDYFGTTLTVSPHKNAMILNKVGHEAEKLVHAPDHLMTSENQTTDANNTGSVEANNASLAFIGDLDSPPIWLESDFKKKNGYLRSIELSKQYDLYRQDYCGCEFARTTSDAKSEE